MTGSDWLQIVLSVLGVLIGAIISWGFFYAQQKADFGSLQRSIAELKATIERYQAAYEQENDQGRNLLERLERTINEVVGTMAGLKEVVAIAGQIREVKDFGSIQADLKVINNTLKLLDNTISRTKEQPTRESSKWNPKEYGDEEIGNR